MIGESPIPGLDIPGPPTNPNKVTFVPLTGFELSPSITRTMIYPQISHPEIYHEPGINVTSVIVCPSRSKRSADRKDISPKPHAALLSPVRKTANDKCSTDGDGPIPVLTIPISKYPLSHENAASKDASTGLSSLASKTPRSILNPAVPIRSAPVMDNTSQEGIGVVPSISQMGTSPCVRDTSTLSVRAAIAGTIRGRQQQTKRRE